MHYNNIFLMDYLIVIKMKTLNYFIFLIVLITNVVNAQKKENDYYSIYKEGKKYLKPVKYILLDKSSKKVVNPITRKISFYIENQVFIHDTTHHEKDTCSTDVLSKIEVITIENLFKDEYKEHTEKTKLENIKMPPPLNHYNLKVFIIEKTNTEKVVKYEVDWVYLTH